MSSSTILQFKVKPNYRMQIAALVVLVFWAICFNVFLFGTVSVGILSAVFFVSARGVEIDCDKRRYREGRIAGNICTGSWKPLPEIRYISVFSVSMVSKVRGVSNASVSSRDKVIKVNLIHGKNGRLTVYKTSDVDDAFENACLISERLGLKILDATSANKTVYETAEKYRNAGK